MRDTIRLFVSSTFKDMGEERDLLNRIVFPYLREFCKKRGIGFVGVDLRWGITAEDAESKKTLRICLDEIDRCRPYFAGILGNRYGWVPPEEFLVESHKKFPKGASITEAEMLYGALNKGGSDAIFLIKEHDKAKADTKQNAARLSLLRSKIRRSGYPLLDRYKSASEISDFFIREFTKIIDKNHPYVEVPDKYQSEYIRHQDYLNDYSACFIGRENALRKLYNLADINNGMILIEGSEGIGKTALLANYIQTRLQKPSNHYTFFCFSEALTDDKEWDFTLKRLIRELNTSMGRSVYEPESVNEAIAELSNALSAASTYFETVVIAIDGIEAITRDSKYGFSWIPEKLPRNVKIVTTCKDAHTKNIILNRKCKKLLLPPLSKDEQQEFIQHYLSQYAKKPDKYFVRAIIRSKHTKNPLFLKVLMSEMVLWNNYEELHNKLNDYLEANSLSSLYLKVFNRVEEEYGKELTINTFRLLYAATGGLKESELIKTLGTTQGEWIPLYYAIKPYIFESVNTIYLTNAQFKQAVEEKYITKGALKADREKLVNTFTHLEDEVRKLTVLPGLLVQTRKYKSLATYFCQPKAFSTLWSINKNDTLNYFAILTEKYKSFDKFLLAKATKAKHIHSDVEILYHIAEFYRQIGESEEAAAILDRLQGLPLITDLQRLRIYSSRGNIYLHDGAYHDAQKVLKKKRLLCKTLNQPLELARTDASLGQIAYFQLDMKKALKIFHTARREFKKCSHPEGYQAAFSNLGNTYCNLGDFAKAGKMFIKQEKLCRETNNLGGLISSLGGQFLVSLKAKKYDEANQLLFKQRKLCLDIGDMDKLQTVIGNQAVLAYQKGDVEDALRLLSEKYDIAYKLKSFLGQNNALANLADLSYHINNLQEAIAYSEKRAALCRRSKNPTELCAALYKLSYFYHIAGRQKESEIAELESRVLIGMHGIKHIEDIDNFLLITKGEL